MCVCVRESGGGESGGGERYSRAEYCRRPTHRLALCGHCHGQNTSGSEIRFLESVKLTAFVIAVDLLVYFLGEFP